MTSTSKTLLFFGNERLSGGFEPSGAPTLQALVTAGYTVKAVIAHHGSTHSRTKRKLEIEAVAKTHNIPVLLPAKPADIAAELAGFQAEAAVLVAYGKLISQTVIDLFPKGIINIHPSLLPLYRGPTPIEQVIRDGALKTGVSLMGLTSGMDNGPLYAQQEFTLSGSETKQELTSRLLRAGGELLIKKLPAILDGSLAGKPQDETAASFTSLLAKADARLSPSKNAVELEREVRAFALWPKSKASFFGHDITVLNVRVVTEKIPHALVLECADSSLLEITELVAPSGKTMSGPDFIRGYAPSG